MLSIGWGEVNPIGSTKSRIKRNIKEEYSPATLNVTNGVHSLELFSKLTPGDVIFVRGNASIVDVAVIVDFPVYEYGAGHDGAKDYCLKVKFTPLFGSKRIALPVSRIPGEFRESFVFDDGRSRTMKEVSLPMAIVLLKLATEAL